VEDQALRFVVFYLPLWLAWVVNVLLYVIVHLRIKRILKQVRLPLGCSPHSIGFGRSWIAAD